MTGSAENVPLTKGERTRQRILDAARELFAQSGYRAVSLREIAAAAAVTHAGVLHHFDSRDAILLALLTRRDAVHIEEIIAGGDGSVDPERFMRVSLVIVEQNSKDPTSVALFVKLSAEATDVDHPAHAYFQRRYRRLTGVFSAVFDAWLRGREPRTDPEVLARAFIATTDGLQLQWALAEFSEDAGAAMVQGVAAFLGGLGFTATAEELEQERTLLRERGFVV